MTVETLERVQEVARHGEAIYAENLRPLVETAENLGKILVLDIATGDYEIDTNGLTANDRLQAHRPNGLFYGLRAGFDVVEGIGRSPVKLGVKF